MMKTGIEKQSQESKEEGGGAGWTVRGKSGRKKDKEEGGVRIESMWVCDLCLGSSVSPGEAAY